MVILFISILAVVAIPRFGSVSETRAELAAKKVASDINYAKTLSMTNRTSMWHRISFDSATDSYTIYKSTGAVKDPLTQAPGFTVQLDQGEYGGVTIQNNFSTTFYYPLGTPSQSGVVTLQGGAIFKNISVTPVTGRVAVK